jgi:predicted ferric reductase/Ca2+-binding EF-hand superfamily protein
LATDRDGNSGEGAAARSDDSDSTLRVTSDVAPKRVESGVAMRADVAARAEGWQGEGPLSAALAAAVARPPSMPPSSGPPPALQESELVLLRECFAELAGSDDLIDAADLQRSLAVKDAFLARRVLAVFDRNRDGLVTRVEFLERSPRLLFGSMRDKLRFAFRIHDLNGDGALDRGEIERMIALGLVEDGTEPRGVVVESLTSVLLRTADANHDGRLSFAEFDTVIQSHPEVTESLALAEQAWLTHGRALPRENRGRSRVVARGLRYLDNHVVLVALVVAWVLGNVGLFVHAWLKYQANGANHAVMLARGLGACLNFNGALILLPMARGLLTRFRRTPVLRALPLDDAPALHRLLGYTSFALALVHSGAHLVNYTTQPAGVAGSLFGTRFGATGLALLLVFAALVAFSLPRVRAAGRFELFYWTHHLYVAWFALALVHGRVFWAWATVPLVLFAVDRVTRLWQSGTSAEVLACEPLASGVTKLTLEKPPGFRHEPGEYVFLNLPTLARHEWHPFTISSAPERDVLTLHVRGLGNFTKALYQLAEQRSVGGAPPPLRAHLDGPFGAPCTRIFEARRAVLIGAGVGVTPFASVLESLVLQREAGPGSLEDVQFYWLNKDAVSFEWFAVLLARLEHRDVANLVKIHIFMTDGRGDGTALLLNLARGLAHARGERDLITGLRAMTSMGAPDWHRELAAAAGDDPATLDVFFCGPPGLARTVRRVCSDLGLRFHQERF